jgi:hypothetical protein
MRQTANEGHEAQAICRRRYVMCDAYTDEPSSRCSLDRRKIAGQTPARNRGQQSRRLQRRLRCASHLSMLTLASVVFLLLHPGLCAPLAGDAQDRAFEDISVLARAGKLFTVAMSDTASVLESASKGTSSAGKRHMSKSGKYVRPRPNHAFFIEAPYWLQSSIVILPITFRQNNVYPFPLVSTASLPVHSVSTLDSG